MELEEETAKPLSAPPVTVKLEAVKAVAGTSEAVKVIRDVPPDATAVCAEVMAMVGASESNEKASEVDVALLPAASTCLTKTLLLPSPLNVNVLPVKVVNVTPASVEYE